LSGFYADAATEREVVKNYVLNQQGEGAAAAPVAAIDALIDDRLHAKTVTAQLRRLSDVLAEEGITRIDLLKINVEKSELDVLMGLSADDWPKIRKHVMERLPQYMIPSAFVLLDQLPLNANGKIDRQALEAAIPTAHAGEGKAGQTTPAARPLTQTERTLGAIWAELLKVDSVGLNDDFFDLGGHSLL